MLILQKETNHIEKKEQIVSKIVTRDAEATLERAEIKRNDYEMLGLIQGVDIISKEFLKHDTCYRDYVRVLYKDNNSAVQGEPIYDKGNFDAVSSIVDKQIILEQRCISMDKLLTVYGIGVGMKQYRHLLKNRLETKYGNELLFVRPEYHSPEVVLSRKCLETSTIGQAFSCAENVCVKKCCFHNQIKSKGTD